MKVGVIGSKSSCEVVKKSIKEIDSSVEVASYEEEQVNRSDRLIEECEQECDAVLFTGCAIESFVGRNYHFTRPHVSVEKSVVSIAGAFLQMQKSNIELDAFSIDIVEKQVIEDLLDAFDILARNIYSCPFQAGVEEEQYVEWHMKLLDEGKVNVALTSLRWVVQKKGNILCLFLIQLHFHGKACSRTHLGKIRIDSAKRQINRLILPAVPGRSLSRTQFFQNLRVFLSDFLIFPHGGVAVGYRSLENSHHQQEDKDAGHNLHQRIPGTGSQCLNRSHWYRLLPDPAAPYR